MERDLQALLTDEGKDHHHPQLGLGPPPSPQVEVKTMTSPSQEPCSSSSCYSLPSQSDHISERAEWSLPHNPVSISKQPSREILLSCRRRSRSPQPAGADTRDADADVASVASSTRPYHSARFELAVGAEDDYRYEVELATVFGSHLVIILTITISLRVLLVPLCLHLELGFFCLPMNPMRCLTVFTVDMGSTHSVH